MSQFKPLTHVHVLAQALPPPKKTHHLQFPMQLMYSSVPANEGAGRQLTFNCTHTTHKYASVEASGLGRELNTVISAE